MVGENLLGSIGGVTDNIKNRATNMASYVGIHDADKAKIKTLAAEKQKMYEFIGMEAYSLYEAGTFSHPDIEPFLQRIKELNNEIGQLEGKPVGPVNTCECGEVFADGMKFCMKCGKKVEYKEEGKEDNNTVTSLACECGQELPAGTKFCNACGRPVKPSSKPSVVECVCGAVFAQGSKTCDECGRRMAE